MLEFLTVLQYLYTYFMNMYILKKSWVASIHVAQGVYFIWLVKMAGGVLTDIKLPSEHDFSFTSGTVQ